MHLTLPDLTTLRHGGAFMWVLLGLSLLGMVFFIERALYLHRGQIRTAEFIEGIKTLARKRRMLEALTVCEETPGPVAAVVKAALLHHNEDEGRLRGAIQATALVEIPSLERRLGTLALIAKIAPLVGLLGTVTGFFNAFTKAQQAAPYENAADFSGYIAGALITSGSGLAIAIVAYAAYHFLHGRVRALVHDMEWVGNDMLQFFLIEPPSSDAPAAATPEPPSVAAPAGTRLGLAK